MTIADPQSLQLLRRAACHKVDLHGKNAPGLRPNLWSLIASLAWIEPKVLEPNSHSCSLKLSTESECDIPAWLACFPCGGGAVGSLDCHKRLLSTSESPLLVWQAQANHYACRMCCSMPLIQTQNISNIACWVAPAWNLVKKSWLKSRSCIQTSLTSQFSSKCAKTPWFSKARSRRVQNLQSVSGKEVAQFQLIWQLESYVLPGLELSFRVFWRSSWEAQIHKTVSWCLLFAFRLACSECQGTPIVAGQCAAEVWAVGTS